MAQACPDIVISLLEKTKGQFLYFDLECDYEEQNMHCFAFSFDGINIYGVPIIDYNYNIAHSNTHQVLKALAIAMRDNIVVAHNGAAFDFFVLAYKYRIPVNKTYDTMLAMHRCFPDIERSLGHCISLWSNEKFHKDSDSHSYKTLQNMIDRINYNMKDVFTMFLIKQSIDKYAKTIPGLADSIHTAMSCIRPYLVTTIHGIRYSDKIRQDVINDNDIILNKYLMLINYLIGDETLVKIKSKGSKASAFPLSNKQCVKYFHEEMGYPVVKRSIDTGEPSLSKNAIFKLQLKHDNPVLTLTSRFRVIAKESSMLHFMPWKNDDNSIFNYANNINVHNPKGNTNREEVQDKILLASQSS